MIDYVGLGPSSQTSNDQIGLVSANEVLSLNLDFFDISSYVVQRTTQQRWRQVAAEVLQEDAELWERLSAL